MLNPKAWADPVRGLFGGPSYYGDFRGERRPVENFAVGRQFQIHEGIRLHIRAEFIQLYVYVYERPHRQRPTGQRGQHQPADRAGLEARDGRERRLLPAGDVDLRFRIDQHFDAEYPPRTGRLVARFEF